MYGANSCHRYDIPRYLFLSSRTLDLANNSSWITDSEMVGRNILSSVRIKLKGSTTLDHRTLVTTLPAPITAPFPILTPWRTVTFPASQQSSPIWISWPVSGPFVPFRSSGSRGCLPLYKETLGPSSVRAPMVTRQVSMMTQSKLMKTPWPTFTL
ncbi:hypothetical protein BJX68DRAFT_244743 [Aspergillus pseudodeflectus]|uniref:Uncharacterized protein n=1 Tax=Aspergillus pseudodeflectus TaxID=176178 RepID=A0ABR4JR11_9EURO